MMRSISLLESFVVVVLLIVPAFAKTPEYLVKHLNRSPEGVYGGGFIVREVIHPKNDPVNPGFSTAYVILKPHSKTKPHRLLESSQVYFVIKGRAILHVASKSIAVTPNTAIYIAPGVWQWAENPYDNDFVFLCIVSPPWSKNEEVVKGKH